MCKLMCDNQLNKKLSQEIIFKAKKCAVIVRQSSIYLQQNNVMNDYILLDC